MWRIGRNGPLSATLIQRLFDPGLTTEHYLTIVKHPVYARVFWNTLEISFVVTLLCIILGYPVAYYLSDSQTNWVTILLIAVLLPFWISVLVRTYSWMLILGRYGVLNTILTHLGWIESPLRLMYNRFGVYVGMVYVMLPYAILPMLSVMQGIDRNLMRATDNLGSTPWQLFFLCQAQADRHHPWFGFGPHSPCSSLCGDCHDFHS